MHDVCLFKEAFVFIRNFVGASADLGSGHLSKDFAFISELVIPDGVKTNK